MSTISSFIKPSKCPKLYRRAAYRAQFTDLGLGSVVFLWKIELGLPVCCQLIYCPATRKWEGKMLEDGGGIIGRLVIRGAGQLSVCVCVCVCAYEKARAAHL